MDRSMLVYSGPGGGTVGVVMHGPPCKPSFERALHLAQTALEVSCEVYVYLLDDAVDGVMQPSLLALIAKGAKVSACGYAIEKRGLDCPEDVCPAGLTTLSDILFYSNCVSVYN